MTVDKSIDIGKDVLTLMEAAQFLGVRPVMIWEYARRWIIRGRKTGTGKWWEWEFDKVDLLWLLQRKNDETLH